MKLNQLLVILHKCEKHLHMKQCISSANTFAHVVLCETQHWNKQQWQ